MAAIGVVLLVDALGNYRHYSKSASHAPPVRIMCTFRRRFSRTNLNLEPAAQFDVGLPHRRWG
eukprot:scaffold44926_cov26-Prasinocladus_malaysianus.AAC.1